MFTFLTRTKTLKKHPSRTRSQCQCDQDPSILGHAPANTVLARDTLAAGPGSRHRSQRIKHLSATGVVIFTFMLMSCASGKVMKVDDSTLKAAINNAAWHDKRQYKSIGEFFMQNEGSQFKHPALWGRFVAGRDKFNEAERVRQRKVLAEQKAAERAKARAAAAQPTQCPEDPSLWAAQTFKNCGDYKSACAEYSS